LAHYSAVAPPRKIQRQLQWIKKRGDKIGIGAVVDGTEGLRDAANSARLMSAAALIASSAS
jgi:hypothetical protein